MTKETVEFDVKKAIEDLKKELNEKINNLGGSGSNQHDVSITEKLAETFVKYKELESNANTQIESMKQEIELRKLEVEERIELSKVQSSLKEKITKNVCDVATIGITVAAIATTGIMLSKHDTELKLEKIKQGEFE